MDVYLWTCLIAVSVSLVSSGLSLAFQQPPSHAIAATQNLLPVLRRLQLRYLFVFSFAVTGDWLQGAYFYAVYQAYGYSRGEIQALFVVGFGSSAIFGSVVGSLADYLGRKRLAVVYFFIYALGCLLVHARAASILVTGRVLSGIATSLLFSTFDSWIVRAHEEAALPAEWLSDTFKYSQLVNSLAAIAAGFVSQAATGNGHIHLGLDFGWGGDLASFEIAGCVLAVGLFATCLLWNENTMEPEKLMPESEEYPQRPGGAVDRCVTGVSSAVVQLRALIAGAVRAFADDPRVLLLCLVSCLFEASMYAFVMQWTPALQARCMHACTYHACPYDHLAHPHHITHSTEY